MDLGKYYKHKYKEAQKRIKELEDALRNLARCWNEDEIYPDDISFNRLKEAEQALKGR